MKFFFANPAPVKELRINHFLKVEKPKTKRLVEFVQRITAYQQASQKLDFFTPAPLLNDDLKPMIEVYQQSGQRDPIEHGVAALLAYYNAQKEIRSSDIFHEDAFAFVPEDSMPETEINIFTPLRYNDVLGKAIMVRALDTFRQPILSAEVCQRQLELSARFAGSLDNEAREIREDLMRDLRAATHYPPPIIDTIPVAELRGKAQSLIDLIRKARTAADDVPPLVE